MEEVPGLRKGLAESALVVLEMAESFFHFLRISCSERYIPVWSTLCALHLAEIYTIISVTSPPLALAVY
jgi:hypothetical protein